MLTASVSARPRPDRRLLHIVEIRLPETALDYLITRMRLWLDQQGLQPQTFRYSFEEADVLLQVDFTRRPGAEALARAFGGEVLS
jgi:hypothetical protein